MTEKRLDKFDMLEFGDENEYWIVRCNKIGMTNEEVVELLNLYEQLLTQEKEKNQLLKMQLGNISAQRDEFYRGARENANRVGKLKKENEQLKQQIKNLQTKNDSIEWLRNNTAWEQIPSIVRTSISTNSVENPFDKKK